MLAVWSDRLFMGAIVVYVLAIVLHAVEIAAVRSVSKPALVGAGAPVDEPAGRPRGERYGRMAVSLTLLGVVLHLGSIVARGVAAERWPLGNMYEFSSAICAAAVVTWLVVLQRSTTRPGSGREAGVRLVGPFVLLPVVALMFIGLRVLYAEAAPVQPALQSYWLVVHVTTISISSGLLLVAGVASVLYLVRRAGKLDRLPGADAMDRLAYRVTIVAFPLFTFAVITGAVWAEAAWGRFWGWDPKETVAFVSWVVYAAYLHARATAGWRAERAAWINVLGFATVLFNLFFINMVVAGLHSYAGLG